MATIIAGIKTSSRAGAHTVDNDTTGFLHDQDGNVAHTAKNQYLACFAARRFGGFSVGGFVSVARQPQASP